MDCPCGSMAPRWFLSKRVKCVGFGDSIAIENNLKEALRFHGLMLSKDIIFIEVMENLEKLNKDTFMLIFLPLPILGLDSCPVRVIAIEGIPGLGGRDNGEIRCLKILS
jgi:kynurenine formamidase